jgi:hypothetical protein
MTSSKENAREILGLDKVNQVDYVGITLASPEAIRSWSKGEVKNPETTTTARSSRKRAAFSANVFSVLSRIGNAPAENTNASSIAASSATVAVSK